MVLRHFLFNRLGSCLQHPSLAWFFAYKEVPKEAYLRRPTQLRPVMSKFGAVWTESSSCEATTSLRGGRVSRVKSPYRRVRRSL